VTHWIPDSEAATRAASIHRKENPMSALSEAMHTAQSNANRDNIDYVVTRNGDHGEYVVSPASSGVGGKVLHTATPA
jgi:hypothetical protein